MVGVFKFYLIKAKVSYKLSINTRYLDISMYLHLETFLCKYMSMYEETQNFLLQDWY